MKQQANLAIVHSEKGDKFANLQSAKLVCAKEENITVIDDENMEKIKGMYDYDDILLMLKNFSRDIE